MPDDERLGGTRDPHEYGRRHRREDDDEQPRRRRRSMDSGGLSVADLVQKHTGSRPDLTPVDPNVPLSQNTLVHGRRSRDSRQPEGIAEGAFPPDDGARGRRAPDSSGFPQDGQGLRNGFPDARRGGEQPSPRRRAQHATPPEPPYADQNGFPPEPPARGHRAAEPPPNGLPTDLPKRGHPAPPNGLPPGADPPRGHRASENPTPRNTFFAEHPDDPHHPVAEPNGRPRGRAGEPRHPNGVAPAPGAPSGSHAVPDSNGRPPRGRVADPNGFPTDTPKRGHRTGETSGSHAIPDPAGPRGRPADPGPNGLPTDTPKRGRRAGEASRNGLPGDASGSHAIPDPAGPRGRAGDPGPNGLPADMPKRGRRPGEGSAHLPVPGDPNGIPGDLPKRGRRPGEASGPHATPGDPNGAPPRGRRAGEGSAHLPVPGGPNGVADPNGLPQRGRRPGENSVRHPIDGVDPGKRGRRPGESSAHLPVDSFPTSAGAPRGVGDAADPRAGRSRSEPGPFPPDAPGHASGRFPTDDPRRQGPPTPGGPPPGHSSGRFPTDDPRRQGPPTPPPGHRPDRFPTDTPPGHASGRFPTDDPRRQGPPTPPSPSRPGPPTPPPANRPPTGRVPLPGPAEPLSEPRITPAAIDAPDARRSTGVPPVPLPPPRRDDDLVSMTTEMEAIGEDVQKRRTIDHTLARFSAVHDEIRAEEREKKAKRRKLRPWQHDDDEMARLDELDAQQSMAVQIPPIRDDEPAPEPDEDPSGRKKKKKRKLKGKLAGKVFTAIIAGLVFTSTAAAWGFKSYIESSARNVDALDPDSAAIQDADAQHGDENFLLVGSDTRAGAAAEDGVGDEDTIVGARSDTVMIAHIPKNRERVVVVSFPRDLEVTRPACEGWDSKTGDYNGTQHPAEKNVKLNTAYQVGGPKCVTKMVQELSGLAVNHFVGIDFHGFKGMVDAVDGVEVCVERPLKDDVLGTVVAEAGKNVRLTGDQALNFVRARHVQGDLTSDYGRIIRQQRFLSALLRKAMSGEVLLNPGKLTNFVEAFSKATFGDNIGVDQLFTLGQSMQNLDAGRVTFITVPTVGDANDRGNEVLRAEDTTALFEAIRQDTPLPGETPVRDDASQKGKKQASSLQQDQPGGAVDPKSIKLQVLNGGNDQDGIAGDTADSLAEYGFEVVRVGTALENVDTTVIRYSKSRVAEAQLVAAAVPGATLQEDPSMSGAIMLIVGPGFDGEVVSPTGEGPVAEVPDGLSTVNAGDGSCA